MAALWLALASPALLAAPAASEASGARAPAKAGTGTGRTPTSPAVQQATQQATQGNHDQYALRPERDVQPRSSFGLRMKPGWPQQDDPGAPGR
ncbi:hypothetical protein UB46_32560 [Burkholderiaceae bacterium 16]|nr:hypothetical protein UB46_32560 [Burkholderiaceae bacterium 16]